MKAVAISEFKTKCLFAARGYSPRKTCNESGPAYREEEGDWLGFMKGRIEILGDIVSLASNSAEWEVLRD
jgi:hypothetical protein